MLELEPDERMSPKKVIEILTSSLWHSQFSITLTNIDFINV